MEERSGREPELFAPILTPDDTSGSLVCQENLRLIVRCSVDKQGVKTDLDGFGANRLTKPGVSDNVGGVKHFLSVLLRALRRARHFALAEKQLPLPTKARS
jgi:hypothetical protein